MPRITEEVDELLDRKGAESKDSIDLLYDKDASVEKAVEATVQLEKVVLKLLREFETSIGARITYVSLFREAGSRILPEPPIRSVGPLVDIRLIVELDAGREK